MYVMNTKSLLYINAMDNWYDISGFYPDFHFTIKEAKSVTLNTFRKKSFLFKSFVKIELSYVFTINMFSTAENCMEKWIIL